MLLPLEILKHILCHLDKEHLKQCLLVSNEFRELIIKTPELMRKLQVIFFNENWEAKMPFIEEYGFYVRSIKFDDCGFRSMRDLRKILKLTPNVETLIFYNCFILESPEEHHEHNDENNEAANEDNPPEVLNLADAILEIRANIVEQNQSEAVLEPIDPEEDEPIDLKKLTYLHLDSCNIAEKLVNSLRNCTTLKKLKITFYYQAPVNFFTDFLCQQNDLQELFCVGWSDMVFKSLFKNDISQEKISFKLKKFTLECELGYHLNFSNFLRSQADNLQELELTCYNINFHYYRLLFNNFRNLKKLTLPTDWFLTDSRANDIKNCRILTLKELDLVGSNDDISTFSTVLNIFPNIEVLKAENIMYFSLFGILEKFTKLRHIKAENFRVETMMFVKLPSLKVIEASYLFPMALSFLWENLSENCPNVEELIIRDIGHFKLNESIKKEIGIIIKSLKGFKQLKHCEIVSSPQDPMVNGDEDHNDVQPPIEHAFYKVIVENRQDQQQLIKLSPYFALNCVDDVNTLKETFSKCDIIEI